MIKKTLLILTLIVFIALALIAGKLAKIIYTPVEIHHILCEIKPGDTGRNIAETLYQNGIIRDKDIFHLIIRAKKLDRQLKAGYYLFTGNLNMMDTIKKIISGEIMLIPVTIPEGLSIYRTFRILENNEIGDYEKYMILANDTEFIRTATEFEVESLEGFLYPDTYFFGHDMSEESVIKAMIENFYNRLKNAHIEIEEKDKFYETIILASIIEKEATFDDEKPIMAGVFLNRIRIGMPLQADPTVTYHLESQFRHINRVTYSMLREETPYNTYVISGLPPHPICSPAISSIYSVLNPEKTDYLYFVADRQGRHVFARSYDQHRQNIRNRSN